MEEKIIQLGLPGKALAGMVPVNGESSLVRPQGAEAHLDIGIAPKGAALTAGRGKISGGYP
jgi:hypothetical protein